MTAQPAIGHNNPPSPIDELRRGLGVRYDDMEQRARALAATLPAAALPDKIETDEQAKALSKFIADARNFAKDANAAQRIERAPYDALDHEIVTFFTVMAGGLGTLATMARDRLDAYTSAKAYEARKAAAAFDMPAPATKDAGRIRGAGGVSVSAASRWTYDVVDFDKVPRELMRVNDAAVRATIAGLKATGAPMAIPGLALREEISARVR